ncbi:hypothetical protein CALVIDRAFT_537708 [Calocera viscosa TUFC12733]|uniref:DUF6533 domain-containing protein n=1 Tax=Calocera viscosa (strain TUFC12733) TaxID=1330018 RepID=A0A167LIB4_CALVF|nr:hypothetical protein CALVIDRAFT_537708 [Calocera viscosa TUFC12733]
MDPAALEQQIQGVYLGVASVVVTSYDAIILLADDINLVWSQKWSWETLLFLCNRVGIIVQTWVNFIPSFFIDLDAGNCWRLALFEIWIAPCQLIIIEAILLKRVVAMYNNRLVTALLLILYLLSSLASLLVVGYILRTATLSPPLPNIRCGVVSGDFSYYWASWVPPVIMETTLFLFTAAKTFRGATAATRGTPLMALLFRDGVLYYAVVFVLLLINLLTLLLAPEAMKEWFAAPVVCLSSVMCSRLFLNLRKAARAHNRKDEITTETPARAFTDVELSPADSWTSIDRR